MRGATKKRIVFAGHVVAITAVLTFLTGCMLGPDYVRPETAADGAEGYVFADANSAGANDVNVVDDWWERFGDPVTSELVREALRNNNDLEAAAARVLQADALLDEARGRQWPSAGYNFSRSRGKSSFNFSGGRFSNLSTTFMHDLTVNYMVDLFGKLRRGERAAWADLLAAESIRQAVVHAVISGAVRARVDIATIEHRLTITQADTVNWEKNLEVIMRRYNQGLVGPLDVRLAKGNLAGSQATEIAIELTLAKAHNALDVLLGRRPGTGERLPKTLAELPDLSPVPLGLPAELLDRRPDVRAAELALESSSERIGVSIAELFPDLTLTGTYGRSADIFDDLFVPETEIYSAIIRVTQPIFEGGQRLSRVRGAKARYAELVANYAQTVLTAIREVEDALASEQMLQKRLEAVQRQFDESVAADELAMSRYVQGVDSLITVLETERRRRIAENLLNNVKGDLWTTRVDLFLALGGDWIDESEEENGDGSVAKESEDS